LKVPAGVPNGKGQQWSKNELYRAEHAGSLPRPKRLIAAHERRAAGQLSKADLTQVEDE